MKCSIYYCYTSVKKHQQLHRPLIFNIPSVIFIFFLINFLTYFYNFSNFFTPFYIFISPLLSNLISLFLYLFIFLYYLVFLFPSSYYNFTILFSILFIIFSHTKCFLSHSLSLFSFLVDLKKKNIFLASLL